MQPLSDSALLELLAIYVKLCNQKPSSSESFELCKEVAIKVCRECGIWQSTEPLAFLAVGVIAVQARNELKADNFDERITVESLGTAGVPP